MFFRILTHVIAARNNDSLYKNMLEYICGINALFIQTLHFYGRRMLHYGKDEF